MTTSIALVSNEYKKYADLKELMTDLLLLHKSLRTKIGSNYLKDRPKLGGENNVIEPIYNKNVLIIEEDEALNLLLESNLLMKNCTVKMISDFENIEFNVVDELDSTKRGDGGFGSTGK